MKFPKIHTLEQIAQITNTEFVGDANFPVKGINEIHVVEEGDITFVDHPKYYKKALNSDASVVIINQKMESPKGKALIYHEDPFVAYNTIVKRFTKFVPSQNMISESAEIGDSTIIQPGVFIGDNVKIGKNCVIGSLVIIKYSIINDYVCIKDGSKIGIKGFGFIPIGQKNIRTPQIGKVILGEGVEIGANCTIDRGSIRNTIIGRNTFLDNHIQIAHNVKIGTNCMIAAQVGIAGSTTIGDNTVIGGQAGISGHLKIGNNVKIGGASGVRRDIPDNSQGMGYPAVPLRDFVKMRRKK